MISPNRRMSARAAVLKTLAEQIVELGLPHPTRAAVDGIDAAGKTSLANELAEIIAQSGRTVIRASVDGFHRPREERYRQGADSPEGYYRDSFDYVAMRKMLLDPLGPAGSRQYRVASYDYQAGSPVLPPLETAPADSILLLDGVFLLRPELNAAWDYRIFVQIDFETCLHRAAQRDASLFGSAEAAISRYQRRYIPGQQIYLDSVRPASLAQAVVINDDPLHPILRDESH